jgi:hypothetical protein
MSHKKTECMHSNAAVAGALCCHNELFDFCSVRARAVQPHESVGDSITSHTGCACRYVIIAHVFFHNRSRRSEIILSIYVPMEILKSCIFAIRLRAGAISDDLCRQLGSQINERKTHVNKSAVCA